MLEQYRIPWERIAVAWVASLTLISLFAIALVH